MTTEEARKASPEVKPEVLAKQEQRLREILDPKQNPPLLLVIDMQEDFIGDEGKFSAMWHHDITPMRSIISKITSLADQASERGIPVVYTQIFEDGKTRTLAGKDRLLFFENVVDEEDEQFEVACQRGTKGAKIAIPIVPGSVIMEKTTSSAYTQELADYLEKNGIKTVIVTGVLTHRCVSATIGDLYNRANVHVVTPRDCVASDELEKHTVTLKEFETFYPPVVNSKQVEEAWKK